MSVSAKQVVSMNKRQGLGARWKVQLLDQPHDGGGKGLWSPVAGLRTCLGCVGWAPWVECGWQGSGPRFLSCYWLPDPWSQPVPSEAGPLSRGQLPWDRQVEVGIVKIHSAPLKGLWFQLHDMCVCVLWGDTWVGMF